MAHYRKLGRTASQRKAMLRSLTTSLLLHGKIETTETRAKEVRKLAEKYIALAVREKDNFETVTVQAKVAKKDKDGNRVKKVVDGKKVTEFETIEKTIKKDSPSRLHARREMLQYLYGAKTPDAKGRQMVEVDLVEKMFDEIAPKYVNRQGGYTRITKIGPRRGDAAMMVQLELV